MWLHPPRGSHSCLPLRRLRFQPISVDTARSSARPRSPSPLAARRPLATRDRATPPREPHGIGASRSTASAPWRPPASGRSRSSKMLASAVAARAAGPRHKFPSWPAAPPPWRPSPPRAHGARRGGPAQTEGARPPAGWPGRAPGLPSSACRGSRARPTQAGPRRLPLRARPLHRWWTSARAAARAALHFQHTTRSEKFPETVAAPPKRVEFRNTILRPFPRPRLQAEPHPRPRNELLELFLQPRQYRSVALHPLLIAPASGTHANKVVMAPAGGSS